MRQIRQTGIITEELGSNATGANHIDTYSTFELGGEDNLLEYWSERVGVELEHELDWSDIEWTYDHKGYLLDLARSSVLAVLLLLPDNTVVKKLELVGEPWTPAEYNFTTDGYMGRWTIDADALEAWLTAAGVTIPDGYDIDGFMRTADDEFWYLANGLGIYLAAMFGTRYASEVLEFADPESDFVDVTFNPSAIEKIEDAGGTIPDDFPRTPILAAI